MGKADSGVNLHGNRILTKLLVSIRDASEALTAVAEGVDLIDIKEPRRGSLGAANQTVIMQVIEAVAGRVPLSMACGELLDVDIEQRRWSSGHAEAIRFAKLGLAGCGTREDWPKRWQAAMAEWPESVSQVAVVYADWQTCGAPAPEEVVQVAGRLGCRAVLVDTFDKSAGNLLVHLSMDELTTLGLQVRERGLLYVLAGSLDVETIETVASLQPNYVAVRGAVCRGSREGKIDPEKVRQIKAVLNAANIEQINA